MRIATWNVESLKKLTPDREAAFHIAMAAIDADVWVLTETWSALSPGNGYHLAAESSSAVDLKAWPDRTWVTLWVKNTHRAQRLPVNAQSDRMACCRIEIPGEHDVVVIGIVLPWGNDELWPGNDGFCNALSAQSVEWGTACEIQKGCTLVVAGDTNQTLPHVKDYGSKRCVESLENVLQTLSLKCLSEGLDSLTGKPRIDHICISQNGLDQKTPISVGEWAIPSVNGKPTTDHSGLFVDLKN
jgi:exonuclease III